MTHRILQRSALGDGLKRMVLPLLLATTLVACLALGSVVPAAKAHRQKMGLTEISVNEATGTLEIAHQFNIHDAEHALQIMLGAGADILQSDEMRRVFAQYVANHFRLTAPTGDLELTLLGNELEGSRLWIYQEVLNAPKHNTLQVRMTAIHDIWPDHVNLVNIRSDTGQQSLLFPQGSPSQPLALSGQ